MPNAIAKTHFKGPVDSEGGFTCDSADGLITEILNLTDTAALLTDTAAGAAATLYLRVKLNGTVYKLSLLADS